MTQEGPGLKIDFDKTVESEVHLELHCETQCEEIKWRDPPFITILFAG